MSDKERNTAGLWLDKLEENQRCDLCEDKAEYHLCQFHMNECVIGERDLRAELEAAEKRVAELEIVNEKLLQKINVSLNK